MEKQNLSPISITAKRQKRSGKTNVKHFIVSAARLNSTIKREEYNEILEKKERVFLISASLRDILSGM